MAGVALLGYALAAFGFPDTPGRLSAVTGAYPCQGHNCGCREAAQCWAHCCCSTREQNLAWARAHRVVVPDAANDRGMPWDSPRVFRPATTHPAGAAAGRTPPTAHDTVRCQGCASDRRPTEPRVVSNLPTTPKGPSRFFSRSPCKGVVSTWVTLGAVLFSLTEPFVTLLLPAGRLFEAAVPPPVFLSRLFVPPPRIGHV